MADLEKNEKVPVRKIPESVPKRGGASSDSYIFSQQQLVFFKHYSEHLDQDNALKEAGVPNNKRSEFLNNPYVENEMIQINRSASFQYRMNAKFTAGKHMELMDEFHEVYRTEKGPTKAMFANTLAKMSSDALKATGQMDRKDQEGVSVTVNIDIGGDDMKTINAECIDVEK